MVGMVQGLNFDIEFLRVFIYDFNYLSQLGNIMKIEKYGLPENYKTWHERIIDYFKENPKKWRTQKQIREGLGIKWVKRGHPDYYRFYDINSRIKELLKDGYLIKAYAPDFLKTKARNIKYVYKWTGKEKKPNYHTAAVRLKKVTKT